MARFGWIIALAFINEVRGVIVDTQNGPVLGKIETSFEGNDFFGFHSIPYAQPPLGDLRFRDPLPFGDWEGVLDATEDGQACIQIPPLIETGTIGQEDCLWLSVYTPSVIPDTNLPVVVWIHGGRWLVGSARQNTYGPHQLVDRGVIVVQIQYRLGALGWLSTEDSVAPGNYGFKDQLLALKWVKANIHAFGGNPEQITLLGQSAGGASAHAHSISPLSKGLFQRVISMSGTANAAWSGKQTDHAAVAKKQAGFVGCPTDTSEALIECLRTVDAVKLTSSATGFSQFFPDSGAKLPMGTFYPRVDAEAKEPFWTMDPVEALTLGKFNKDIAFMTGLASLESSWFTVELFGEMWADRLAYANENQQEVFKLFFPHPNIGPEDRDKAFEFYFNRQKWNRAEHRVKAAELMTDSLFNLDVIQGVYLHTRQSHSDVYFYKFNYIGSWGYVNLYKENPAYHGGVAHLDDLRYVMSMPWTGPHNEEDKAMVKLYTTLFANFIRTGDPSIEDRHWAPYLPLEGAYININSPSDVEMSRCLPIPADRLNLWRDMVKVKENLQEDYLVECQARDIMLDQCNANY
ncbi:esterase E4-like [Tigriopus californicus]|uniref:esterase E4-like n=1 Tax=Tigriopus californicus TaxID=6832 RepID=UPI0027DA40E9|nr:esterase E4-like [Tigriopus californicus]